MPMHIPPDRPSTRQEQHAPELQSLEALLAVPDETAFWRRSVWRAGAVIARQVPVETAARALIAWREDVILRARLTGPEAHAQVVDGLNDLMAAYPVVRGAVERIEDASLAFAALVAPNRIRWHDDARGFVTGIGLDKRLIFDALGMADTVEPDQAASGTPVRRFRRGDVSVAVGFRPGDEPLILHVRLHRPEDGGQS